MTSAALIAAFALTAALYAAVGFAGGSTYTALLVLAQVDYSVLPLVSLLCNIIVSIGGTWRFAAVGAVRWRRIWPLLAVSVPLAWLGGSLPVGKPLFVLVLGGALVVAGLLLLAGPLRARADPSPVTRTGPGWPALLVAAPIGLLSGIVGIGGGIFLAPLLHLMRWDSARRIAGAAALFILVNSIAGLAGQLGKAGAPTLTAVTHDWWMLFVAVLIGGSIGSLIGARHLAPALIRRGTGLIVLIAGARLLLAG